MMNLSAQLAKHLREVYVGGNWTSVNFKDTLQDIDWQEAAAKLHDLNTIGVLAFHVNYYIEAVTRVLEGHPLEAKDAYSFDLPPLQGADEWNALKEKLLSNAEKFAALIEQVPGEKLATVFVDEKYGTYFRNLFGIIEHCHYHLGQIALIKKMLRQSDKK